MAPHSSILAWRIPWTEEPEGYSPWGLKEQDMTERLHFILQYSLIIYLYGLFLYFLWLIAQMLPQLDVSLTTLHKIVPLLLWTFHFPCFNFFHSIFHCLNLYIFISLKKKKNFPFQDGDYIFSCSLLYAHAQNRA